MLPSTGNYRLVTWHIPFAISGDNINLDRLASLTIGMTGADIANIVNQAALVSAKKNKTAVCQEDLEYALDKARMGKYHIRDTF